MEATRTKKQVRRDKASLRCASFQFYFIFQPPWEPLTGFLLLGLKMTITKFSIEYDAVNNKNVFTNGDTVNGRIFVQASKDSPIRSLALLAKGEAVVHWFEDDNSVDQHKEYYNIKHYILQESGKDGKCSNSQPVICNSAVFNLFKWNVEFSCSPCCH